MAGPLVLVVDDDPTLRELVREKLEAHGNRVATAHDGDAVSVAQRVRPDLILLDMVMQDMDGAEVCALHRTEPLTAATPIVAVSGLTNLLADSSLPADDRLRKPYNMADLLEVVARWVKPA